jgi:hypothetical protein
VEEKLFAVVGLCVRPQLYGRISQRSTGAANTPLKRKIPCANTQPRAIAPMTLSTSPFFNRSRILPPLLVCHGNPLECAEDRYHIPTVKETKLPQG